MLYLSMFMKICLIYLVGFVLFAWNVHGMNYKSEVRCECNGKSAYCLPDALGLQCLHCQDNTAGRHCEKCKDGFYSQRAGERCVPCKCNIIGSAGSICDSQGHCSCKPGASGEKCDRCSNGAPISSNDCTEGQLPESPNGLLPCLCYGHLNKCSEEIGCSAYNITSTFAYGPSGWRVATAKGLTLSHVHFGWSPTHQDIEVISNDITPMYLYAPAAYLGNQELSYDRNLSFSLRLDRGVRYPSSSDVILEGSGLRTAASLGELHSIIPSGQKITYTLRLNERASSKWRPHLTTAQFQTLLRNLTAIKIRATFGVNGRGYLDNVNMGSARRRPDDCYAADETPSSPICLPGFYKDSMQPLVCVRCPCPKGESCSVNPNTLQVACDPCPHGTTGSRCHICKEGFYGDPHGEHSLQRPCQPCQCNGHIDTNSSRNCDPLTGECLRCRNHTTGFYCDTCLKGYHHSQLSEACKPCDCNSLGSVSNQCSDSGQCSCKEGYEGSKCQHSTCPSCFRPFKTQIESSVSKLHELETLLIRSENDKMLANNAQIEKSLRASEKIITNLEGNADRLSELEQNLQARLLKITTSRLSEDNGLRAISNTVDSIKLQDNEMLRQVLDVTGLIKGVMRQLQDAKIVITTAGVPLADAALSTNILASLVRKAGNFAQIHDSKADTIEKAASNALTEAENSLALMKTVLEKESKVRELVNHLKIKYDETSALVKALESHASKLNIEAGDKSRIAGETREQISALELEIPDLVKGEVAALLPRLDILQGHVQPNITGYHALQEDIQRDKATSEELLTQGQAAQKEYAALFARVNAAKASTEISLREITDNVDGVKDALTMLRGFDALIIANKPFADRSVELPGINKTIQQAVEKNSQTLLIINNIAKNYEDALATVDQLETAVSGLEEVSNSLSTLDLLRDATELNKDLQNVYELATDTQENIDVESKNAERQKQDAVEASLGAAGAYKHATHTRDAVRKTLQAINDLFGFIGQPDRVDEKRLSEIEGSIVVARNLVNQQLLPYLKDLERKESTQRTRLLSIDLELDTFLGNIKNLEDIFAAIPKGCFNSPPIERP